MRTPLALAAALLSSTILPLSVSADAPADIFYDLNPAPKKSELSFDTGDADPNYCVCWHKECWKYIDDRGKETEYIKCVCVVMTCTNLNMDPY